MGEERQSIWSVPRWAKGAYYLGFSAFTLIGAIGIGIPWNSPNPEAVAMFLTQLAPVAVGAAGLSLFVIEILDIGVSIMVLSEWLKDKKREWDQKNFEERIDKEYGPGTADRLKQDKQQQAQQNNNSS